MEFAFVGCTQLVDVLNLRRLYALRRNLEIMENDRKEALGPAAPELLESLNELQGRVDRCVDLHRNVISGRMNGRQL